MSRYFNAFSCFRVSAKEIAATVLFAARNADCSKNGSARIFARGGGNARAHRTCPLHKATKWPRCHLAVRARRPTHGTATQTLRRYRGAWRLARDRAHGMSHFLAIADLSLCMLWIPGRSSRVLAWEARLKMLDSTFLIHS